VFESEALVYDEPSENAEQESRRKRRTIAGNAQLVRMMPWLVLPWKNPIWFQFVSHKLLRLVSPLLLVTAFAANALLLGQRCFAAPFLLQCLFYVLAWCGSLAQASGVRFRLGGAAMMFVALNVTTLLALGDAARGKYHVRWER
jgi:hypothetical protein